MINKKNLNYVSEKIKKKLTTIPKAEIIFQKSKDNLDVPMYKNVCLHSKYYPLKEAKKYQFSDNDKEQCIAIGFGAGYHLIEYARKKKVIAICADIQLLHSVLSLIDLSKYFPENNLVIITEQEICNYFDFFATESYFLIVHRVLQQINNNRVSSILQTLKEKLNTNLLDLRTQKSFGKIWHKNIIKNLKKHFDSDFDISPLTISKKPIVITGAGPSLAESIDRISAIREKVYIAASDTSYKILVNHNIHPDFIFSFDPSPYTNLQFLPGSQPHFPRLFIDFLSSMHNTQFNTTLLFTDHPFKSLLNALHFETVDFSSAGRNIGTSIITFFKNYFPGYPLIVTGIDFAYHKYASYSPFSYLHEYKIVNSSYFNTMDNIDTKIFYAKPFLNEASRWKTTSLQSIYNNESNFVDVFTLSESPFTCFKRNPDLLSLIDFAANLDERSLTFPENNINKDNFLESLDSYLVSDPSPLIPFFLSKGVKPEIKNIQGLLEEIKFILK